MVKPLSSWRLIAIAAFLSASPLSRAAVIIDIYQSGSDVVSTGSGTIHLPDGTPIYGFGIPAAIARLGTIMLGTGTEDDQYNDIVLGPDAFGPGGPFYATSGTGPYFGLDGNNNLIVPVGYVSGTFLSSTAFWSGLTLAEMGLALGTYVYTITGTLDTITVNISSTTPVPEPSTVALLALTALALLSLRQRQVQTVHKP